MHQILAHYHPSSDGDGRLFCSVQFALHPLAKWDTDKHFPSTTFWVWVGGGDASAKRDAAEDHSLVACPMVGYY